MYRKWFANQTSYMWLVSRKPVKFFPKFSPCPCEQSILPRRVRLVLTNVKVVSMHPWWPIGCLLVLFSSWHLILFHYSLGVTAFAPPSSISYLISWIISFFPVLYLWYNHKYCHFFSFSVAPWLNSYFRSLSLN